MKTYFPMINNLKPMKNKIISMFPDISICSTIFFWVVCQGSCSCSISHLNNKLHKTNQSKAYHSKFIYDIQNNREHICSLKLFSRVHLLKSKCDSYWDILIKTNRLNQKHKQYLVTHALHLYFTISWIVNMYYNL